MIDPGILVPPLIGIRVVGNVDPECTDGQKILETYAYA